MTEVTEDEEIEILDVKIKNFGHPSLFSDAKAEVLPYPGSRMKSGSRWIKKRKFNGNPSVMTESSVAKSVPKFDESYYFDSYAHHGIHETMLKDRVRTLTYRDAILSNKHLFKVAFKIGEPLLKDKIVLDVGCGTGILSMFAAQAGASRVIGIDNANIALYARKIVEDNNFQAVITIIHGKVEEVELPDGIKKVDIIISEWMGYCLLLESMLETVLFARDKWLKFNGVILPDKCSLYIAAISDENNKRARLNWWKDVYNFDMSSIQRDARREARVTDVYANQVMTTHYEILEIDLNTVYKEELCFTLPFSLELRKEGQVHAFVTFFSVNFSRCHTRIRFTTAPEAIRTHWKQTVFYFKGAINGKKGETIKGKFRLDKFWKNYRTLIVEINWNFDGELSKVNESNVYCVQ